MIVLVKYNQYFVNLEKLNKLVESILVTFLDRGSTPRTSTNGNVINLKERLQTSVTGLHGESYQGIGWYLSSTLRPITLRKVPT